MGNKWKKAVASHDTLLFNLEDDPGEKINLYPSNKEFAKKLIHEMWMKHEEMGDLAPSLILKTPQDNSHFKHLTNSQKEP